MTIELKSRRKGPARADSAVVLLHGYGADGADLLGLADVLQPHLPGTAFHAPDAPERCRNNPMGFQWFPIPWMDGSSPDEALASAGRSVAAIHAFLDRVLAAEGIGADRLALVGFSQGTMMSLEVAPRRAEALAGVVGFSGRLLDPERLAREARLRPPVLLAHGDQDPVVPFESMAEAAAALRAAGFDVRTHVMRGTPHGISPDGLAAALDFLRERLAG